MCAYLLFSLGLFAINVPFVSKIVFVVKIKKKLLSAQTEKNLKLNKKEAPSQVNARWKRGKKT